MFYFISKYKVAQIVIIVLSIGIMVFQLFSNVPALMQFDAHLSYSQSLAEAIIKYPIVTGCVVLVMVLLQIVLLWRYFKKNHFTDNRTFLPIFWFCLLLVGGNFLLPLTPAFITLFTINLLFMLNGNYNSGAVKNQVLLSGILIGIASLYDLAAIWLLLYVILSVVANRFDKFKEIVITFIGLILPYIYVAAFHYIVGDISNVIDSYSLLRLNFPLFFTHFTPVSIACLIAIVLIIPFLLIKLKLLFDNKLIIARKQLVSLNFLFVSVLLMFLTTNVAFPYSFVYFILPFAVYFSIYLPTKKFNIWREILFIIITCSIVLLGWQL